MHFFNSYGYLDAVGDFSLSERFIEILGKQKIQGGTSPMAWQLMQKYGCIPRSTLTYSIAKADSFNIESDFVNDYFNPLAVTNEMRTIGQMFLTYVNIAYQTIGKNWYTPNRDILRAALQQAPVCIGLPTPVNVFNWNNEFVQYDGNKVPAHEVELHDIDETGQYKVSDQYNPSEKTLSRDYYICFATQGIVYSLSKPVAVIPLTEEQSYLQKFWTSVNNFFNKIPNPFQIG